MDALFSSRYPFSAQAKETVSARKGGLSYEEVEAAKARVIAALSTGELKPVDTKNEEWLAREIFSYAGARVIIAYLESKYFRGRYAVAESKRVGKYLRQEGDSALARVAGELGVPMSPAPYRMKFTEYLRFAPKDVKYKLVNKPLSGGMVALDRSELIRVIEEAARLRIEETIPASAQAIPPELKKAAEEVRKALPKTEAFGAKLSVNAEDYPPCVKELIARLQASENLPHTARWFLAAFLLQGGMKEDDVVSLFRSAPDFDERTTRYQVEYIAKKGYRVPSCSSAESYGICAAVCGVKSPVGYAKRRAAAKSGNAGAANG
jgi:DNA primase large subunit